MAGVLGGLGGHHIERDLYMISDYYLDQRELLIMLDDCAP